MPIDLTNPNSIIQKPVQTAKFFHKSLTGKGGKVGLLNEETDTLLVDNSIGTFENTNTYSSTLAALKNTQTNDTDLKFFELPSGILIDSVYNELFKKNQKKSIPFNIEIASNLFNIESFNDLKNLPNVINLDDTKNDIENHMIGLIPKNITIRTSKDKKIVYNNEIEYAMILVENKKLYMYPIANQISYAYNTNNQQNLNNFFSNIPDKKKDEISNISISKTLAYYANKQNDDFEEISYGLIDILAKTNDTIFIERTINMINYFSENIIETLGSSYFTNIVNKLYQITKQQNNIKKSDIDTIISSNLRLMLANKLSTLNNLKTTDQLYKLKIDDAVKQKHQQSTEYSNEQKTVILSEEPLIVAAAGAGTGKSHTLKGRLEYLQDLKIDMSHVLILSFTNTAATNIKQRFNGVQSLTLADMFNKIYIKNFPNQILTNPITLSNAVQLINPKAFVKKYPNAASDISKFINLLNDLEPKGFKKVSLNITTAKMSKFIKENLELVLDILESIEQTTLALQPIIINTFLESNKTLYVPKSFEKIDIMITDESQDISTFEYILLLEMTIKQKSQLLIVGDGSQTLYEFRNSNPKFLTSIQASGVFANFNLTTNYRSHGTILAYANPLLDVIEANEQANIQLVPNKLNELQPSESDFDKHISISHLQIESSISEEAGKMFKDITYAPVKFIIDKLNANETVAIIGATNLLMDEIYENVTDAIASQVPNLKALRLASKRKKPSDIISSLITKIGKNNLIQNTQNKLNDVDSYSNAIINLMSNEWANGKHSQNNKTLPFFVNRLVENIVKNPKMIVALKSKNINVITGTFIKEALADETRRNNSYNLIDGNKFDIENSNLIVTTGHSAKGLEFDNTVIVYDETSNKRSHQDSLRMLYVTLTRAKQHQYIINMIPKSQKVRSVGNNYIDLFKTPIDTLSLMTKHYANNGTFV